MRAAYPEVSVRTVLVVAMFWSFPALAQDEKALAAAHDLVEVMRVEQQIQATIDPLLDQQIAANPDLAPVQDVMRAFFTKYFTADEIRPRLAQLYAEHFTASELKVMTKFYRTSAGQKLIDKEVELTAASGEIGRQIVLDHQDELQRMVMEKLRP